MESESVVEPIPSLLNTVIPNEVIYFVEGVVAILLVLMITRVVKRYRKSNSTQSFVAEHFSERQVPDLPVESEKEQDKAPAKIVGHYIDDFF